LVAEAPAWSALFHDQTGAPGWERALEVGHQAYLARNPAANAHFNAAMAGNTSRALSDLLAAM